MVIGITGSIIATVACKILKTVAGNFGEKVAKSISTSLYERFFAKEEKISDMSVSQLKSILKDTLVQTDEISGRKAMEIIDDSLTDLSSSFQEMRNDINELRKLIDDALDELIRYSSSDAALHINNIKYELTKSFLEMSEEQLTQFTQQFETILAPYIQQVVSHVTDEHDRTRALIVEESQQLKAKLDKILDQLGIRETALDSYRNEAVQTLVSDTKAEETSKLAEEIVSKDPEIFTEVDLLRLGLLEFKRFNLDKAITYFERTIAKNPSNIEAYNNLGNCYLMKKDLQAAKKYIYHAYTLDKNNVITINNLASIKIEEEEFFEAETLLDRALAIHKSEEVTFTNFGMFHIAQNQYKEAISALKIAIEVNSEYAPAYNFMGLAYLGLLNIQEAIYYFERVREIDPYLINAINNLGFAYQVAGDIDKAEEFYNEAINRNPKMYISYNNLGLLELENKKNPAKALELFMKAYELFPGDPKILYNIGNAHLLLGHHDTALEWFYKALEINPNHSLTLNILGALELDKGNIDVAEEYFVKAIRGDPFFELPKCNLAIIYAKKGDLERAVKLLEKTLEDNDRSYYVWYTLAELKDMMGDTAGAQEALRRAKELEGQLK